MIRAVLTSAMLLAVLTQAVFGFLARHSHPAVNAAELTTVVTKTHDHLHAHGHHHHGHGKQHHHHAPHIHFGGDSGEEHQHEETGGDAESFVVSRLAAALIHFEAVGHLPFDVIDDIASDTLRGDRRERMVACGRSGWPSGQRFSLLGAWLI